MYNEILVDRIREVLANLPVVEEKKMFGGVCFMVDHKLCICVRQDMMCRINPEEYETLLEKQGVRPMDLSGKSMKGYLYVDESAIRNNKDFDRWINKALTYNKIAKASKKRP